MNLQTRDGAVTLICHIITFAEHDADTSGSAMHINARMFGELTEAGLEQLPRTSRVYTNYLPLIYDN